MDERTNGVADIAWLYWTVFMRETGDSAQKVYSPKKNRSTRNSGGKIELRMQR